MNALIEWACEVKYQEQPARCLSRFTASAAFKRFKSSSMCLTSIPSSHHARFFTLCVLYYQTVQASFSAIFFILLSRIYCSYFPSCRSATIDEAHLSPINGVWTLASVLILLFWRSCKRHERTFHHPPRHSLLLTCFMYEWFTLFSLFHFAF